MLAYNSKSPGIIKSIQQRSLFELWNRLRAGSKIAPWSALDASDLASYFESLNFIKVEGIGGYLRFRMLARGKSISQMFGEKCSLKYIDRMLPPQGKADILESYCQVVWKKHPVYTSSTTSDGNGVSVYYERLLLPFSTKADHVTHIIGSFEPISPSGAFDRNKLLSVKIADAFTVKAVIKPHTYKVTAALESAAGSCERKHSKTQFG